VGWRRVWGGAELPKNARRMVPHGRYVGPQSTKPDQAARGAGKGGSVNAVMPHGSHNVIVTNKRRGARGGEKTKKTKMKGLQLSQDNNLYLTPPPPDQRRQAPGG